MPNISSTGGNMKIVRCKQFLHLQIETTSIDKPLKGFGN